MYRYSIGDEVYLKTDEEQRVRIVTGIFISNKDIIYYLAQGINETKHYDFEIDNEKTNRFI